MVAFWNPSGLSQADVAAWVFGVFFLNGVLTVLACWLYRQPLAFLEPAERHHERRPIHRSTYCVGESFDEISHSALMDRVRKRVGDKRVLALVKAFLKTDILGEDRALRSNDAGTPQDPRSLPRPRPSTA
jgi:hypothetical protein